MSGRSDAPDFRRRGVKGGDAAGAIYDIADPAKPPFIVTYKRTGVLWTTRGQGRIAAGDAAAVVIVPQN